MANGVHDQHEPLGNSPWGLMKHVFLDILAFLIIFGFAIALDWFAYYLKCWGIIRPDTYLETIFSIAKYAIATSDLLMFLAILIVSTWRAIRRL